MLLDARTLEEKAVLDCDVCIVGAGAAGFAIACELAGGPLTVLLIEAGGASFRAAEQDPLQGSVAPSSPHAPAHLYRRHGLGGATAVWGGRCVPMDPIDFEARPYVPHSGWPVGWDDVAPFYRRAHDYLRSGACAYTVPEALGADAPETIPGFRSDVIDTDRIERFSEPTDFAKAYLPRLRHASNVRILVHAHCLRVETAESGAVTALACASEPQRHFAVRPRFTVVAAGGLEATRLLLASDRSRRGGLGNESGRLGRFYMCHIENTLGRLCLMPQARPAVVDFERTADGVYVRRKFCLNADAQRRHGLMNATFRLHFPFISNPAHRNGILSAVYLAKDCVLPEYRRKLATIERSQRDRMVQDWRFWAAHVGNVARDTVPVGLFGADWVRRRILPRRKLPHVVVRNRNGVYPLDFNMEQVPNPDSRVALGADTDAFGVPRLHIDWRMTEQDIDSILRTFRVLRQTFAQSGCAKLDFDEPSLEAQARDSTPIGGHHMGTTRMAASPRDGVVDANCEVFGAPGLFIAGSAVFPTCGHANPTLTIVALAVRLADHLKMRARGEQAADHANPGQLAA
ncbi:FAD-dependent oxidoreductase [Azospirillum sp.]|uniref:FAD-dependent oxidoreductase n=1 Tax=Azospirillum sp. TaxID=34012 RepID=UPI003D75046A